MLKSKEELLNYDGIKQWRESHKGSSEEIEKAAAILYSKQDAVVALKKILPALSKRVITVFFSYKKKDEVAAKAVVGLLRKYAAGKLDIIYQADFPGTIVGQAWRTKIKQAVSEANWFILLLPDPSEDWDWCLYETGLFDRQITSADRMICLHHPNSEIPDPISEYEHVKAEKDDVQDFLRMVYLKKNPIPGLQPINEAVENDIDEIATKIVDAIRPPAEQLLHKVFEPHVALSIANAEEMTSADDLDAAMLVEVNEDALEVFDYQVAPRTWGELRAYVVEPEGDRRWREELFHVIRRIASGRRFFPVQAVFQSNNGRYYRPTLHAIDRHKSEKKREKKVWRNDENKIVRYHLTFTEDISYIDRTKIPIEVYRLAAILRFAFRFRWEILEKFTSDKLVEDDIERLQNAFKRLNKEWESRELGDQMQMLDLFSGKEKERVFEMFLAWDKVRNKSGTGLLDKAIEANDLKGVVAILKQYMPMNKEFLEMTADRFSELIQRD